MLIGFPPKVLKWTRCFRDSEIGSVVVIAAKGDPFPIPLAMVMMSGLTPQF